MKRFTVTRKNGKVGYFDMEEVEGNKKIALQIGEGDFGKPQRWVHEDQCSEQDKLEALQTRVIEIFPATELVPAHQVPELDMDGNPTGEMIDVPEQLARPAVTYTEYELPAEYTIEITDVTLEYAEKEAKEDKVKLAIDKMKLEKGKDRTLSQLNKAFDDLLEALGY